MESGYPYNPRNPTHINLDFIGKISPDCGNQTCCSCVLVSKVHVLTAWHCVKKPCGDFCVQFPVGKKNRVTDLKRMGNSDIAIGILEQEETIKPIRISPVPPLPNSFFLLAGWGVNSNNFDLRFGFTFVDEINEKKGVISYHDNHSLAPIATAGDSGGAVISHDGSDIFLSGTISKKLNKSACLYPYFTELKDICSQELNGISKDSFSVLCSVEVAKRKMVEEGFGLCASDDWIDIDRWLVEQMKHKASSE